MADGGGWETYGGSLRFTDGDGNVVEDGIEDERYAEFIGEAVEADSFLKSPYFRPLGYPDGCYRVGPLARLNVCDHIGAPLADKELTEYRQRGGRTVNASFFYHYARLIEILASIEFIEVLLDDPAMHATHIRAEAGVNRREGVGVSEAPRGTLFHHYQVDENGLLTKVNLLIATGQNALGMNRTIKQIAQRYIHGEQNSRNGAEPRRSRHSRIRPLPELFDARRRPDAADCAAHRSRRHRAGRGATPMTRFLVIGYGNELRGDDAAGPYVAHNVADWYLPGVDGLVVHQLTPELAPVLAETETVVFVDARADDAGGKVCFHRLDAGPNAVMGHMSNPRWLLALAEALYGRRPEAWLLTIPAADFGLGMRMSATATAGVGAPYSRSTAWCAPQC